MQIDDDETVRMMTQMQSELSGLTYLGVSCLNSLEEALSANSARIHVVDGMFPEQEDGKPSLLAPRAVELIREHYQDPSIVLYSSEDDIHEIAEELRVSYIRKPSSNLVQNALSKFN